jgi:hypothetical protein
MSASGGTADILIERGKTNGLDCLARTMSVRPLYELFCLGLILTLQRWCSHSGEERNSRLNQRLGCELCRLGVCYAVVQGRMLHGVRADYARHKSRFGLCGGVFIPGSNRAAPQTVRIQAETSLVRTRT